MTKRTCVMSAVGFLILGTTFLLSPVGIISADSSTPPDVPAKGMVTMLDFGASYCPPCKAMAPFLEKLEKEYKGRAAIIVLDIGKVPELSDRFRIEEIPTQIFLSTEGEEIFRHTGFMSEEDIRRQLNKMGVN